MQEAEENQGAAPAEEQQAMGNDPFAGGKEIKPNKVAFNKIGDFIIGYWVGVKDVNGQNGPIKLYELKGIMGSYHEADTTTDPETGQKIVKVHENAELVEADDYYILYGGKDQIDGLFKKARIGQKVGLRFESVIPAKKAGNSPFKTFKTTLWDEMDPGTDIEDVQI